MRASNTLYTSIHQKYAFIGVRVRLRTGRTHRIPAVAFQATFANYMSTPACALCRSLLNIAQRANDTVPGKGCVCRKRRVAATAAAADNALALCVR